MSPHHKKLPPKSHSSLNSSQKVSQKYKWDTLKQELSFVNVQPYDLSFKKNEVQESGV